MCDEVKKLDDGVVPVNSDVFVLFSNYDRLFISKNLLSDKKWDL